MAIKRKLITVETALEILARIVEYVEHIGSHEFYPRRVIGRLQASSDKTLWKTEDWPTYPEDEENGDYAEPIIRGSVVRGRYKNPIYDSSCARRFKRLLRQVYDKTRRDIIEAAMPQVKKRTKGPTASRNLTPPDE